MQPLAFHITLLLKVKGERSMLFNLEEMDNPSIRRYANKLYERYQPYMEAFKSTPYARMKNLKMFDFITLGEQLFQFERYCKRHNMPMNKNMSEGSTLASVGVPPVVVLDLITASHGSNIMPMVASVQPIRERIGAIYFKKLIAATTRGNVQAGQQLAYVKDMPEVFPVGFAGEKVTEEVGTAAEGTLTYTFTFSKSPVRQRSVRIMIEGSEAIKGEDNGEGDILGIGLYGTVKYGNGSEPGTGSITFINQPEAGKKIIVSYGTDFEANGQLPEITTEIVSEPIEAEIFGVKTRVGRFQEFELKNRFGMIAAEEMIQDLTNEVNNELANTLIERVAQAAVGNVVWQYYPPSATIPEATHRLSFLYKISQAESVILAGTGRGIVNVMLVDPKTAYILDDMPEFNKSGMAGAGATFYGTLKNTITVIRCPQLPNWTSYCIFRGEGPFNTPIVYAPYMPFMLVDHLPVLDNVLKHQAFCALWSGLKTVVQKYITKLTIDVETNKPQNAPAL
jgi:ribosomal protein S17E